jgi:hypothetical protein
MDKNDHQQFEEYGTSPLVEGVSRLFQSIGGGIAQLFLALWRGLLFSIHFLFSKWLALGLSMLVFGAASLLLNSFSDDHYVNYMELKPRFSIESQLINDIGYLNSLIETGNHQKLADV